MSKYVKDLLTKDLAGRLEGVDDALLVNVIGLSANKTVELRKNLRDKNIHLLVVKNSLARRATEGTQISPAFEGVEGTVALVWGGEDFVSLAKEVTNLDKDKAFEEFQTRGGVMDGEHLTPERVTEISKWPSRVEQLSILSGQILAPGSGLAGALLGPAGALASQIEQKAEGAEDQEEEASAEGASDGPPQGEAPPEGQEG